MLPLVCRGQGRAVGRFPDRGGVLDWFATWRCISDGRHGLHELERLTMYLRCGLTLHSLWPLSSLNGIRRRPLEPWFQASSHDARMNVVLLKLATGDDSSAPTRQRLA